MSFDFLKNIRFKETTPEPTPRKVTKNPEGLTLRVYRNGRVYPSQQLVEKFNLEYNVNAEGKLTGNGIDFFSAHNWGPYPKDMPNLIFLAFVPRNNPKVDLFLTRRTEKTSVLTQAPVSTELWNTIMTIYPHLEDASYIDLTISEDQVVVTEDNIYNLPKVVSRGENKGTAQYVRRENIALFPAVVNAATNDVEQELTQEINNNI